MKASVFALSVMAALTLLSFSFSCTKPVIEATGDNHLREGEIDMPWHPPYKPEDFDALFDKSNLVAFAEVVQVVDEKKRIGEPPPEGMVGIWSWFHRQAGNIKLLRVLKGPNELSSKTIDIIKEKSDFYLEVGRKRVFYLKMDDGRYRTVDVRPGAFTLPWVLSEIKNLKLERGELNRGGVIVAVSSEALHLAERIIHIFKGRLKTPVEIGDQSWEEQLIKTLEADEFGVSEVELPNGRYTFLLELDGNLYSHHPRLVNGYFASLIVENNWRPIFFRLDEIVR